MREIPLKELLKKLAEFDELIILEMLEINSHKLVRLLQDVIEEKYEVLIAKLDDEDEEDE